MFISNLVFPFVSFIGILIFFENLELHFCGLDNNLKKNIMERSINDINKNDIMGKNRSSEIIEIDENYYTSYDDALQEDNNLLPRY